SRKGFLGYSSVSRNATRAWTSAAEGFGPCMLLVYDSTVASSRRVCQPCQVQGLVWVTRRRVGTFLRLRRWKVLRSCRPSLSVSKSRPLVWPSLWQVWQLYHWLKDRPASWKRISPRRASETALGPPSGIVPTSWADSAS